MTREDIEKIMQSGKLSNPQLRELDFMLRRIGNAPPVSRSISSKKRAIGGHDTGEPLSIAEQRLQQLQLFRQRQRTQAAQLAEHTEGGTLSRDMVESGKINWLPIGPAGVERGQAGGSPIVSGRVKDMAIASGGNRVYIASANGGVWYSNNAGHTWASMMDGIDYSSTMGSTWQADSLACGAIALVEGAGHRHDKLFVGTGEGYFVSDAYMGVGPLVSSDGGHNWNRETATPSLMGEGFFAIVVDPNDTERAIAATKIGLYIRESVIGGYEWARKAFNNKKVWALVVGKNSAQKRFYATVFNDVTKLTEAFSSEDAENWTPLMTGFPIARAGRTSLAIQPNNPNVVYAMVSLTNPEPILANLTPANPKNKHLEGVYRLDWAADKTWHKIIGVSPSDIALLQKMFGSDPAGKPGQGDYDNCIAIAPDNINRIYLGGSAASDSFGNIYRCELIVATDNSVTAQVTAIGNSTHADIHALVFVPNEPHKLWVACDGGVFYSNKPLADPTTNTIFEARNLGLQTMTLNYLGLNPKEEENFFACAQDNGMLRYLGNAIWLHSFGGDAGHAVVNWDKTNEIIATYSNSIINKTDKGGNRPVELTSYNYSQDTIIMTKDATGKDIEHVLFYAPLIGIPYTDALGLNADNAKILAFGTQRPWISTDFGATWNPIPSLVPNSLVDFTADVFPLGIVPNATLTAATEFIQSMAFASPTILLVGTNKGNIYKYVNTDGKWAAKADIVITKLNDASSAFLTDKQITSFAVLSANRLKFYITIGRIIGTTDRVWFFDDAKAVGTKWLSKSGSGDDILMDVNYNTIAINPNNANDLFAGSDVGVWRSKNAGSTWQPFSFGLPEAYVIDLKFFSKNNKTTNDAPTLLRASTHGRGVYECNLSEISTPDVKLYLRGHILDKGRNKISLLKKDPRDAAVPFDKIETPDIKIDTPNTEGRFLFSNREALSWGQFYTYNEGNKGQNIPIPEKGMATSRVYIQVNSRGILPANDVRVMLLLKEVTAAPDLPNLPIGYQNDLKAGIPINREGWKTVDIKAVSGVRAGAPQVVRFDVHSTKLPKYADVGAGKNFVLVALLHHPQDEFNGTLVNIDPTKANNLILSDERKVIFKKIRVVQHAAFPTVAPLPAYVPIPETATAAEAPFDAFLGMAFRLNDRWFNNALAARLAQPISNRGTDGEVIIPQAGNFYFGETIQTLFDISLEQDAPLIWFARQKIVISNTISGVGKSTNGDFGGGGGGGATTAGADAVLPHTNPSIVLARGGAIGATNGGDADPIWASRVALFLAAAKGGAAGGDDNANKGGLGGGIVVLCAPIIEFAGNGKIDVSGDFGAVNAGGGGGGLILLIAGEIINANTEGATPNLKAEGGNSGASNTGLGGKGGKGIVIIKKFK